MKGQIKIGCREVASRKAGRAPSSAQDWTRRLLEPPAPCQACPPSSLRGGCALSAAHTTPSRLCISSRGLCDKAPHAVPSHHRTWLSQPEDRRSGRETGPRPLCSLRPRGILPFPAPGAAGGCGVRWFVDNLNLRTCCHKAIRSLCSHHLPLFMRSLVIFGQRPTLLLGNYIVMILLPNRVLFSVLRFGLQPVSLVVQPIAEHQDPDPTGEPFQGTPHITEDPQVHLQASV